jgi:hypothetical protein
VDRLDVCTERIALVLGPDSVLAIARYVRKPAAAWTGDHAASFYRTIFGESDPSADLEDVLHRTSVVRRRWSAVSPTSWYVTRQSVRRAQRFSGGLPMSQPTLERGSSTRHGASSEEACDA